MAKRTRRRNPESENMMADVDEYVRTTGAAIDVVYEQRESVERDIKSLEKIKQDMASSGRSFPKEASDRLREDKHLLRDLDQKISLYIKNMVSILEKRYKRLEGSALAKLRASELRQLKFDIARIKGMAKVRSVDARRPITEAMGSLVTLERELTPSMTSSSDMSASERRLARLTEQWKLIGKRWKEIRKHAIRHPRFYIRGSEVVHDGRGFGRVIESDGRRVLVRFDKGADARATMDKVLPADVAWVDKQFEALGNRVRRGEEITKSDLERIVRKIKSIHAMTKPRARLRTYSESKRALESLIGKIQTRLSGDKMDKAEVEKMLLELEEFQRRISSSDKSTWSREDQRQWASDVNKVRKSLTKLRRRANPCVGFHFHGKDADELLRALEDSAKRQSKPKSNPKKRASKKASTKRKTTKKKVAKKSPRRNPTSASALTSKCRKLWDSYCDRPSKTRLKLVLDHLEKMKVSSAKSVKEERASCLRVANREAKRLGMK